MIRRRLLAVLLPLALAAPVTGQVDTTAATVDSVIVTPEADLAVVEGDTVRLMPITPRTAFIRSMVLPGWGQAAFDSYVRGGIFFAGWVGNWYMIIRNYIRLADARDRLGERREVVVDSVFAAGKGPLLLRDINLEQTLEADFLFDDLGQLVRAREQQREDWIAWQIFWILASGVDGYVTAHLHDFPASIDMEPAEDGRVSLRVEVPLPVRRP